MQERRQLYVDGRWVPPTGTESVDQVNPFSRQVIGRTPVAGAADVDRAVQAARAAFDHGPWPRTDPRERAHVVASIAARFGAIAPEMATLITAEMGAPIGQPFQTALAEGAWQSFAALGVTAPFEDRREGSLGTFTVRREPVGVVAAIVPWNAPQALTAVKLAPALVAGCTVVLKPAPETTLDAFLLADLLHDLGLPPGVVNIVPGGAATGELLVGHPGIDKVAFTGSRAAGRQVATICGEHLRPATLELGGKSAAVILNDADLDATMGWLRLGCYAVNGQTCAAQSRVLAPRARYDEVVEALAATTASLVVGDPADPATDIGPLATAAQQERVLGHIARAEPHARVVAGGAGAAVPADGWFVAPTVLADVDNAMPIARQEVFGPVVAVIPYDDDADAVRIADDSDYGLAGSVWTGDTERGLDIAHRIRTGVYAVNTFLLDPSAPFGGVKGSGYGREAGPEGLAEYFATKSVICA